MSDIDFKSVMAPQVGEIKVKAQLKELPFGKPNKTAFFWVRSGTEFESPIMYMYTPEGEMDAHPYLVKTEVAGLLEETGKLQTGKFYLYVMYGSGTYKLDFINMGLNKYGKMNKFNASRKDIYENEATKQWVRIRSNADAGYYSFAIPEDNLDKPKWSEKPANIFEAIQLAFGDFVIDSKDHPEIKKIRGKL